MARHGLFTCLFTSVLLGLPVAAQPAPPDRPGPPRLERTRAVERHDASPREVPKVGRQEPAPSESHAGGPRSDHRQQAGPAGGPPGHGRGMMQRLRDRGVRPGEVLQRLRDRGIKPGDLLQRLRDRSIRPGQLLERLLSREGEHRGTLREMLRERLREQVRGDERRGGARDGRAGAPPRTGERSAPMPPRFLPRRPLGDREHIRKRLLGPDGRGVPQADLEQRLRDLRQRLDMLEEHLKRAPRH